MGGVYLSESRETPGALALDQGAQALVDESGPLRHAREALCLTEQVVVEVEHGAHGGASRRMRRQ